VQRACADVVHVKIVAARCRHTSGEAVPLVTPQRKIDRLAANGDDDKQEGNDA
jgi:hypothetical protein